MYTRSIHALAGLALFLAVSEACRSEDVLVFDVYVAAGKLDRLDTPVSAALSDGIAASTSLQFMETTGGATREIPYQVEPGKPPRLHWILGGRTAAGAVRTFRGFAAGNRPRQAAEGITLLDEKGKYYEFQFQGKRVLRYNYGMVHPASPDVPDAQARNAYIHPVWTPGDLQLTMDFPPNHLHHRGIWFPWTHTEFEGRTPDFWNLGDLKGTVRYDRTESTAAGPIFGSLRIRHRHVDLKAPGGEKDVLKEVWDLKIFAAGGLAKKSSGDNSPATAAAAAAAAVGGGYFLFDLESIQECAGTSPLLLPQYRYGGLGFRGSWDWEGEKVKFLTSEGKTRPDGEDTPARWCDISGLVGGKPGGLAILCHPKNFRFPQPVRIHPSEPFFNFSPVKAGDMEIEPGKPYISKYRFVAHDGEMPSEEIERFWRDYAFPPAVSLKQ